MLASLNILDHVVDTPWPGCTTEVWGMRFTWMSSGIATMLLVAVSLAVFLPWMTRRYLRTVAVSETGGGSLLGGVLEVIVLFVRNQIAVPSLGKKADVFLPFLLTLFLFVLGINLSGLTPFSAVTGWLTHHEFPVGHTPTSILTVCAALASLALIAIAGTGLLQAARHSNLPFPVALLISPVLWFMKLAPHVPGVIGKVLLIPLALLELIGVIAKCFALMVRLFANMVAGHIMLAVLMMFILQTLIATYETALDPTVSNEIHFFYVAPICIVGSVLVDLMELLVAGLQAYIYTFLTAMFLGLYGEPSH
ncbi:MAG: F0F1 ATP synthase subunit A [Phycisphaerae bacterium]|nr:F0F1 ATP synthase subunit A [Phycisphaerae bacterium]